MHNADDVVHRLAEDGKPAAAGAPGDLDDVLCRVVRRKRVDFGTRGHHIGGAEACEGRDCDRERRGVLFEHTGQRRAADQARELLGRAGAGELLLGSTPIARRTALALPLNRAIAGRNTVVKPTWERDDGLGGLPRNGEGEVLRDQLAQDHRQDGRDRHADEDGDGGDDALRPSPGREDGVQEVGDRRLHRVPGE